MTKRPPSPVRNEFSRLEGASLPWWAVAPSVAWRCIQIAILPLRLYVLIAEAIVTTTFASIIIFLYLLYKGYIPDALVAEQLGIVGNRILGIVQASGIL
jgi:hypothetical protein